MIRFTLVQATYDRYRTKFRARANQGDFAEALNVTLYYNVTTDQKIGTQTTNLLPGEEQTIIFNWDTSGVQCCHNYTLTATATIVPVDNDPSDNTFTDGKVKIRIPGDANGDGTVDMADVSIIADAFLAEPGHPLWNPDADMNYDNSIDMADISIVVDHFLGTC